MIIVIVMMKRRVGMGRVKQTRMRSETTVGNLIKDEIFRSNRELFQFQYLEMHHKTTIISLFIKLYLTIHCEIFNFSQISLH